MLIDLETCCIGPVEFDVAHLPVQVAAHYRSADPELTETCRILATALATVWRWDREDSLPDGRRMGIDGIEQVRGMMRGRRLSSTG